MSISTMLPNRFTWVSHHMTPVSTLRHIFRVAQRDHQFVEELSDAAVRNRRRYMPNLSHIPRHSVLHEILSSALPPTKRIRGGLGQPRGKTGSRARLLSTTAASLSLRESFLALRSTRNKTIREDGKERCRKATCNHGQTTKGWHPSRSSFGERNVRTAHQILAPLGTA